MTDSDALRRAAARALPLVDLTSLDDDADEARIVELCARAETAFGHVAAVCVWPRFVALARERLLGSGVHVAAVANFPQGGEDVAAAVAETEAILAAGGGEVDLVMPYRAWLDGKPDVAAGMIEACRERLRPGDKLKVILETGRLRGPRDVAAASRVAIVAGAHFLKTSTGRIEVSATPEAVEAMLRAVRDSGRAVGIKAAGGIRTAEQAASYLGLADRIMGRDWAKPETFRFGASGLLADLVETLQRSP